MAASRVKNASSGVVRTARRTHSGSYVEESSFPTTRTAPPTRAKSGCWTCRLRRKKCDENRRADGTCDTCKRLRLQCLGWGPKRPDWCRDKEKVEKYKLDIKQQVSINGSPRPPPIGDGPSTSGVRAVTPNSIPNNLPSKAVDLLSHNDNYFGFSTSFDPAGPPGNVSIGHVVPSHPEGDLDSFPLLSMYTIPAAQIWPDQSTPELPAVGNESPIVNPITSAINQSMANIKIYPPSVPSAWDHAGYSSFGYLPSLNLPLSDGSSAAHALLPSMTLGADMDGISSIQPMKQPQVDPEVIRRQIFYYFNRVRKMQYCLAGESTKDVLRDLVVANPYGVVTNAICALASIHHIRMLQSIGQETEDPESATSLPRRFYTQVNEQIMASKTKNGSYTALDATAALQLVSFSLFVGGIRGWENALQIAGDWFEKTAVLQHENPLRAMWELNVTAKFASRLVVWFDIFASITQQQPARFLPTYRKMLRQSDEGVASQKFWRKDLNMQATMGCPDAVLLAIAEIADLAAWRDQEKKQGCLSYRELNLRADAIEQDLRMCKEELDLEEARAVLASSSGLPNPPGAYLSSAYANTTAGVSMPNVAASAPGTPSSTSGESVSSFMHATPSGAGPITLPIISVSDTSVTSTQGQSNAASPTPDFFSAFSSAPAAGVSNPSSHSSASSSTSTTRLSPTTDPALPQGLSDAEIRRRVGRIFLEGTYLYLQSVVNDSNPNVAEVADGVRATMEAAYLLPPSDVDKSLVFPFFIAGVMAENPDQREFFRARLSAHRAVGNCPEAVKLMEAVWKRREDANRLAAAQAISGVKYRVHWRDVMSDLGMKLLLI